MLELVELERRHDDFSQRGVRVIAVSMEGTADAMKTQSDFPHLLVLADEGRGLSEAASLVDAKAAPDGSDVDAPTTILVDKLGMVRWLRRPPAVIARLSPDEVLGAIDANNLVRNSEPLRD